MSISWLNLSLGVALWSVVAPYHSAPQPSYYDNRERVAARMTFEWTESSSVRIPLEWITNHNKEMIDYVSSLAQSDEAQSAKTPPQAFDDMLSKLLIDEKIANMVFELTAYYMIERYSEQIHIRTQKQVIDINQAKVLDNMFEKEVYLQGNFVIEVSHDPSDGQITAVQLARCNADVLGLGSPFGGHNQNGWWSMLVFHRFDYMGASSKSGGLFLLVPANGFLSCQENLKISPPISMMRYFKPKFEPHRYAPLMCGFTWIGAIKMLYHG
jgi:hypothetical protein